MNATHHAIFPDTLRIADDADIQNWLEALAAGECTTDEFVEQVLRREHEEPDAGWEALALLDQQFRRHQISQDDYANLKSRLYQHFVGIGTDMSASTGPAPVDIPVLSAVDPAVGVAAVEAPLHGEMRVGAQLYGRYRVVEILRRTASGTLVEALDEQKLELGGLRKRVAIQVVDEALAREPECLQRIGCLQDLSHPAIARLFDVHADDTTLLLVTELLNGPSLRDLLSRTGSASLHTSVIQSALQAVASALAYAHSQGVTHGNVSAENIIITQSAEFRLQGFELQDIRQPADTSADRLAFARLAYQILSGASASSPDWSGRLRAPQGLSREQWHALRDTLKGRDGRRNDVLLAFSSRTTPPSFRGWKAATSALIAIILCGAGYFYLNERSASVSAPAPIMQPAAATIEATVNPAVPERIIAPEPAPVITASAPVRPKIDLPLGPAVVETTSPVARIWVRRRGSLEGPVTFKWWTENGSAEAERDFRKVVPRQELIPDGASGVEVLVPLMPDSARVEARTFWIKIDEPGRGATLGSRTLLQVAIVPPGYPVQR